jgi:hypothetical protein
MLSEQLNRLRLFATIRSKWNNGLNMTRIYYSVYKLTEPFQIQISYNVL